MTTYWRHATVGIAVAAAILTPSNDPLTMLMMAIPMAGLYLLSIGLVKAFEPKADGTRGPGIATMVLVAMAPIGIIAAVGFWLVKHAPVAVPATAPPMATGLPGQGVAGGSVPLSQVPLADPKTQADIDALRQQLAATQAELDALKVQVNAAGPARTRP